MKENEESESVFKTQIDVTFSLLILYIFTLKWSNFKTSPTNQQITSCLAGKIMFKKRLKKEMFGYCFNSSLAIVFCCFKLSNNSNLKVPA